MEKVVYFLGAGFSAPFGLPLMNNFLVKSKDQYFTNPKEFSHFLKIFEAIEKLSVSKNYYEADLFNIEEILSILEMQSFLGNRTIRKQFIKYIIDVIKFCTPRLKWQSDDLPSNSLYGNLTENWLDNFYGADPIFKELHALTLKGLHAFTFNLLGLSLYEERTPYDGQEKREFFAKKTEEKNTYYGVISLNYDLLLENIIHKLSNYKFKLPEEIKFNKDKPPGDWNSTPLYKLHGCVSTGSIIPPTWAKGDSTLVRKIWKNAFKLLTDTNHIRLIGYSLPDTDTYVQFLLKAASINCKHLKSIDVLCLDPDKKIEKRYRKFFKFNDFRFKNAKTEDYLNILIKKQYRASGMSMNFDRLEEAHSDFMESKKEFND